MATGDEEPGGGSAAALTVSFAAALVAMVARCSHGSWSDAAGIAAQALAIRDRAVHLARTDAEAWRNAVAALDRTRGQADDAPKSAAGLERALTLAAAAPLEIAELGADTALLAAAVAERCDGAHKADAAAAAALAAGAARAAAHLVEVNLTVRGDDERLLRANRSADAATDAARHALETPG